MLPHWVLLGPADSDGIVRGVQGCTTSSTISGPLHSSASAYHGIPQGLRFIPINSYSVKTFFRFSLKCVMHIIECCAQECKHKIVILNPLLLFYYRYKDKNIPAV